MHRQNQITKAKAVKRTPIKPTSLVEQKEQNITSAETDNNGSGVLGNDCLPPMQWQALASQVGQMQGNRYLQRVITVNNGEKLHQPLAESQSNIQRWDSPEHVNLGDFADGVSSGLIELECHNRDLPQRQQSPDTWPTVR